MRVVATRNGTYRDCLYLVEFRAGLEYDLPASLALRLRCDGWIRVLGEEMVENENKAKDLGGAPADKALRAAPENKAR